MIRTVQAVIGKNGEVRVAETIKLDDEYPALVMIMDKAVTESLVVACEQSLSEWNLTDEDSAWKHLQQATTS